MNILNTLNKKTMIAMMIAATGLSTSMAAAQFKVDYSAKSESAPEVKTEKTVMIFQSNDDKHAYEIKIVNGEIVVAKIDGNDVDRKKVIIDEKTIIFINDDGKAIHEIKLPEAPAVVDGVFPRKQLKVKFPENIMVLNEDKNLRLLIPGNPDENGFITMQGNVVQPKVMLGINLGEPSKILRKHLNLKDGMHAILVERVIEGLPAQAAGLQEFDVIIFIDGSDQASGESLGEILAEKEAGDTMKLVVIRSGDKLKLKVELAEYNAQALGGTIYYEGMKGFEEIKEKLEAEEKNAQRVQLEIFTKIEDGEFGHMQEGHITKLKEQLHAHLSRIDDQRDITIELREKAMDAMKQAERQMVEFEDGKLMVRRADGISRIRLPKMPGQFPGLNTDDLHEHISGMNERLEHLEVRLDQQIDEMSEQMDRLMSMFDRLMDRLEENDD